VNDSSPGDEVMSLAGRALMLVVVLVVSACTAYGVVENKALSRSEGSAGHVRYTIGEFARSLDRRSDEVTLAVAFSGGGTRAAALSYGVMQELRDTVVPLNGKDERLLDAISAISSVSGGSFTSAYYGLYGDRLFVDFEDRFLRRDIEGALLRGLLNRLRWFSSRDRTEMAVAYSGRTFSATPLSPT
jgi:NTE family protein